MRTILAATLLSTLLLSSCQEASNQNNTTHNDTTSANNTNPPITTHTKNPTAPLKKQHNSVARIAESHLTTSHMTQYEVSDMYAPDYSGNSYPDITQHTLVKTSEQPVSTFSIDVDTTSYSIVRTYLNQNRFPPHEAVRVEELINYFDYDYPISKDRKKPFETMVAVYETPWNKDTLLMHIGLKGHETTPSTKPAANLVFLIDTSGSMHDDNKLELLKKSFHLMIDTLDKNDTISIVTYAGSAGTVLEPTKVADKDTILRALHALTAGGSTAGQAGIETAYALAQKHFDKNGINRVILATDGDFNVGISDTESLISFIKQKRKTGIYLSVLGFGMGNYKDTTMQSLAQNGNGNAAYIDTLHEAQKVMVDASQSLLYPIANDVKIQVEFNPHRVAEYRLIGYETRKLAREDFNNDKVDAGEIGAGHAVTALYEITPVGSRAQRIDELRYGKESAASPSNNGSTDEYAYVKVRYKLPGQQYSKKFSVAVTDEDKIEDFSRANADIMFAASVAAFGEKLRDSNYLEALSFSDIYAIAKQSVQHKDPHGYRTEFLKLVQSANLLAKTSSPTP